MRSQPREDLTQFLKVCTVWQPHDTSKSLTLLPAVHTLTRRTSLRQEQTVQLTSHGDKTSLLRMTNHLCVCGTVCPPLPGGSGPTVDPIVHGTHEDEEDPRGCLCLMGFNGYHRPSDQCGFVLPINEGPRMSLWCPGHKTRQSLETYVTDREFTAVYVSWNLISVLRLGAVRMRVQNVLLINKSIIRMLLTSNHCFWLKYETSKHNVAFSSI